MKAGIIGAGFFGEKHAVAMKAAGVDLVAACRTNMDALRPLAQEFDFEAYTDYDLLLSDPRVEAVVIATPHATHGQIAVAAAQAGKHILLEKPMAVSLAECDEILATVEGRGVTLMLGHVTRFSRAFRLAKAMIEAGDLGAPVAGHAVMRKRWFEPNRRQWHLDREQGGGVLLTGGIHAVDRLHWLIGSPVTSVSAQFDTSFHEQRADDHGVMFFRYESGAAGTVHSVGYDNGAPEHGTEITCTNGVIRIHSVEGVSVGQDEVWTKLPESGSAHWADEALVLEWQEFQRAVATGTRPAITGRDARHVMASLFAAEESSRLGLEVSVSAP
ncbi:MAG: Gfo/Idh/MocA family oxidoreductase [Trueperaceae bacterium]